MSAESYFSTINQGNYSSEEEELLQKEEYKTNYNSDIITIMIGKTNHNIIIRNSYYELKINMEYLSLLTKAIFSSIDESFEFMKNIFNQKKFQIKEKSSNILKLIIKTYDIIKGKEKEIELCLVKNVDNEKTLIKELFNKYINIEKEVNEVKNSNKIMKEENDKLKQDNVNLRKEIESIKYNHNNDIGGLQIQIMNILQQINWISKKLNKNEKIEEKTEDHIIGSLDVLIGQIKPKNYLDYFKINEYIESITKDGDIKNYKNKENQNQNIFAVFKNDEEIKSKFNNYLLSLNTPKLMNEGIVKDHIGPILIKEIDKLFEKKSAICKIEYKNSEDKLCQATGFFCQIEDDEFPFKKALFTNNHVINDFNINTSKINIKYYKEYNFLNIFKKRMLENLPNKKKRRFITSKEYDYTFCELFDDDEIDNFFLIYPEMFDENKSKDFLKNQDIFTLQFPVDISFSVGKIINIDKKNLLHNASTKEGSSGSPIIRRNKMDKEEYEVIGLHYQTLINRNDTRFSSINFGIRFDSIISDIKLKNEFEKQKNNLNYIILGMNEAGIEQIFKIFIFGDNYKDSIISESQYNHSKNYQIKGNSIKLTLWVKDKKFEETLPPNYIKKSIGFIYVYDIANKNSFKYIKKNIKELKGKYILFLIGNIINEKPREVYTEEGLEFAKLNNMLFLEINSFTGQNIEALEENLKSNIENILNSYNL